MSLFSSVRAKYIIATQLKVFGGTLAVRSVGNKDKRIIVAASSKKRAVELLNYVGERISPREFSNYFSESKNTVELEVAQEEGVWFADPYIANKKSSDYNKLSRK